MSLSASGDAWGLVNRFSISSYQGTVLSRRPVAERRHLGRVFCGLTCPLRYAPSESAAAGITQCLDGRPSKINDQSAPIPARRIRIANHPLRFQTHFKGKCYCAKQPAFILHPPALSGSSCLFSSLHFPDRFLRRYRSLFLWQYQDFLP